MALPAFEDEGSQLRLIRRAIDAGEWLQPLRDGKPLETWLMAPLFLMGSPPLAAIRAFHVLIGIVGTLLIYRLCLMLTQKPVAFVCGIVFACCPFTVYLQRLALSDILMTTAGIWVLCALLEVMRQPTSGGALSLGLGLFLGALCKLPVGFIFLLPVALALLLMPRAQRSTLLQSWPKLVAAVMPTVLLAVLIAVIALHEARTGVPLAFGIQDLLGLGAGAYGDVAQVMGTARPTLLGELNDQLSWPVTLLAAAGLIPATFSGEWRQRWLIASGLIPLLLISLYAHFWFSRYLLFTLPPLFVASVCGWHRLSDHAGRDRTWMLSIRYRNWVIAAALIAGIALMERQSLRLILDPLKARWSPVDRFQYIEGWSSGYGYPEAARYLVTAATPRTTVYALDGHSAEQLLTYLPGDWGNAVRPIFYGPDGQVLRTEAQRLHHLLEALKLSPQDVWIVAAPQLLPRYLESTFGTAGARQLVLQLRAQFDKPGGRSQIAFYVVTLRD